MLVGTYIYKFTIHNVFNNQSILLYKSTISLNYKKLYRWVCRMRVCIILIISNFLIIINFKNIKIKWQIKKKIN